METPKYKFSLFDDLNVYPPSEDTFLLIDALELDIENIRESKPLVCLEFGCGSGLVITALAMALRSQFCRFFGVDINEHACSATKQISLENNVDIEVVRMDLNSAFVTGGLFDVIIFNPPYVLTDPNDPCDDHVISKSWIGGERGRDIIDRLFTQIYSMLSEKGVFYLLVLKENEPEYIIEKFKENGLTGKVLMERRIIGEYLYVLKFEKAR